MACFKFKGSYLFPLLLNLASWLEFLSVIGDHLFPDLVMGLCFAGIGSIDYYWDLSNLSITIPSS